MLIKVCGMRDPQNIKAVDQLPITLMGFIFYSHSPRFVTEHVPSTKTLRVGVFVNEDISVILQIAQAYQLTHIQLHGSESAMLCQQLQAKGYKVIKAISLSAPEDMYYTIPYQDCADLLLFDTKCSGYGGSGEKFDWSILNHYHGQVPFLLSGGINPESIDALVAIKHPRFAGVDLNSGFEEAPAYKNIEKLHQFITDIL